MTEVQSYESGRSISIPSSWEELDPKDVQFVFREFSRCASHEISPLEFNIRVLYRLFGFKPSAKSLQASEDYQQNVYLLCDQCLRFLFDSDKPETLALSFDSVKCPLPAVKSYRGVLYSPGTLLEHLTFGEFRHASAAVQEWFERGDVDDLDECLAVLYRRKQGRANKAGRRVSKHSAWIDRKDVSRWAPWMKNLALMWFSACLKYLQSGKLTIDGEEIDLSQLFSKGDGKGPGYTWNDMLYSIAKEGAIGTAEQVDEEPLFSIIQIMWVNHKDYKRYEETSKANKPK